MSVIISLRSWRWVSMCHGGLAAIRLNITLGATWTATPRTSTTCGPSGTRRMVSSYCCGVKSAAAVAGAASGADAAARAGCMPALSASAITLR